MVKESNYLDTYTPEDLSEEQQMIVDTVVSFGRFRNYSVYDKIENKKPGLTEALLEKAGELGLLG